ncbi:hypothetical protein GmHk_18G052166 [Glycine max]|nr:hypothetical protein GmHk_18G052166 [Glycine max]
MARTMMKINKKSEEMFNTIHIMDQPYGEVSMSFAVRWKDELKHTWHLLDSNDNMHSITYNQNLVSPNLLAGWIELRDFYGLTPNHQVTMTYFGQNEVSSTMYSFMKAAGFTHLNLEEITKCRIVYIHWRKTAKIGNGWRTFAQSQNLQAGYLSS